MSQYNFRCEHECRNTCAALTRALQLESSIVQLSEEMLRECEDENIKSFLSELAENSSEQVLSIMQKLNEIRARMQINNNMNDMFN
jgi:rubrerythrin